MAIRSDYLCWAILGTVFITSLPSIAESTKSSAQSASADTSKLVGNFEGFRSCPYTDPVGVPTIGYGNTYYPDGRKVTLNDACLDKDKAQQLMQATLNRTAKEVDAMVTVPLTANQKTALTSFAFNVGTGALKESDLLKKLNAGDKEGAAQEFDRWTYGANKQVLPGLVDRRQKEKQLFKDSQSTNLSKSLLASYSKKEVNYFLEVALGAEFSQSTSAAKIRKWQGDVNIQYSGSPTSEDLTTLNSVIREVNDLTNGEIHLQLVTSNPNITIHFAPESQFKKLEPKYQPGNYGYFWTRWDTSNRINHANILITTTKVTQKERSHLIREELTQSLGLMQDSYQYRDSIFYQPWTDVTQYSAIDKTLIKMLYNPKINSGMTRSQVLTHDR